MSMELGEVSLIKASPIDRLVLAVLLPIGIRSLSINSSSGDAES